MVSGHLLRLYEGNPFTSASPLLNQLSGFPLKSFPQLSLDFRVPGSRTKGVALLVRHGPEYCGTKVLPPCPVLLS